MKSLIFDIDGTLWDSRAIVAEGYNDYLRQIGRPDLQVDADADIRLCRRAKRDVNKRGRSLESVLQQYQETVKPMYEKYVEPSKKYAHILVPEGGKNTIAQEFIISLLEKHLEGRMG